MSLDDSGSSETTYTVLRAVGVDSVKIDGRFVRESKRSERDRAFLKSVAAMCQELGIHSVAETVEDEATARLVQASDIGYGQDYLFGRPNADPAVFRSKTA